MEVITIEDEEDFITEESQGIKVELDYVKVKQNVPLAKKQPKQLKKLVPRKQRQKKPIPWVKLLGFSNGPSRLEVSVDAFNYCKHEKVQDYFLSHFHSDHYYGMTQKWDNGRIICSEVTAKLAKLKFKKRDDQLLPLKMNVTYELYTNLFCTFLDANHCPGSVIILFEMIREKDSLQEMELCGDHQKNRKYIRSKENLGGRIYRVLHCGDFRVSRDMIQNPLISCHELNKVYLDTTYLDPRYSFPKQDLVVNIAGEFASLLKMGLAKGASFQQRITDFVTGKKAAASGSLGYLFCIGTYSIGKEKVALEMASRLNVKIYAREGKRAILATYDPEFLDPNVVTDDPYSTNIHLVPMQCLNSVVNLDKYFQDFKNHFTNVIGINPTGWNLRSQPSFSAHELRTLTKTEIVTKSSQRQMDFTLEHFTRQFNVNKVLQIYLIPYSEHSSFRELCLFLMILNVGKVIPTVNINSPESIKTMELWFEECRRLKETRCFTVDDLEPCQTARPFTG